VTVASTESKSFYFLRHAKDCIVFGLKIKLSFFQAFVEPHLCPTESKVGY